MDVVGWSGLTWPLRSYGRDVVTCLDLFIQHTRGYGRGSPTCFDLLLHSLRSITDVVL